MTNWATIAWDAATKRGAQQRPAELETALRLLDGRGIRRAVEIGVHDAGTLWAWSVLVGPGGTLVGVDLTDENVRQENVDGACCAVNLELGDSRDPELIGRVTDELGGPIDFLFIDGDHRREAIVADYEAWAPHVADDGAIGFHDTAIAGREGWQDVLAAENRRCELLSVDIIRIDDDDRRMGIGLLLRGTPREPPE